MIPYVISIGRGRAYAVEIKSFQGESDLTDFQRAIGQFVFYRSLIRLEEPTRKLFLAVPVGAYENVFPERIARPVLAELAVPILVFQPDEERIKRWIP